MPKLNPIDCKEACRACNCGGKKESKIKLVGSIRVPKKPKTKKESKVEVVKKVTIPKKPKTKKESKVKVAKKVTIPKPKPKAQPKPKKESKVEVVKKVTIPKPKPKAKPKAKPKPKAQPSDKKEVVVLKAPSSLPKPKKEEVEQETKPASDNLEKKVKTYIDQSGMAQDMIDLLSGGEEEIMKKYLSKPKMYRRNIKKTTEYMGFLENIKRNIPEELKLTPLQIGKIMNFFSKVQRSAE